METLWQDLRFGWRMLIRRPAFSAIAILALALGIGANTAIFSVVNTVLLKPLPYRDPQRLVLIWTRFLPDLPQNWVSGPEVVDFRERSKSFESLAVLNWPTFSLTGTGEPEQIQAGQSSTLQTHPELSARAVAEAALKGDALAISAFERAGHYLGMAVANYLAIFDPSILVFGGGVSQVGDLLFNPFKESLHKHVFHPHYLDDLVITRAALGDDAGLLGALALARLAQPKG